MNAVEGVVRNTLRAALTQMASIQHEKSRSVTSGRSEVDEPYFHCTTLFDLHQLAKQKHPSSRGSLFG